MKPDPGPRRAHDLMTSPVLTVPPDAPRPAVAALLVSHGIASAPVVDGHGRLLGMVDELHLVGADDAAPAAELMTRSVPVVDSDTPIAELVDNLLEAGTRAVPVVCEEVPVGIVSRRDVLRRGELVAARPDDRPGAEPADWGIGPIVVGVNGSEGSIRAIRWAAAPRAGREHLSSPSPPAEPRTSTAPRPSSSTTRGRRSPRRWSGRSAPTPPGRPR